ncbi:uncharacterized protein LOC143301434 isoform X2 [Babylonia areolata]|uniref:uncharacterized protein LOC143301434 isoform X2 n=1 Tax=Babylonia areolata TaxID=304850 RepID=UPI003FD6408B
MADHSLAHLDEITAEDENRRNCETDDMHSVLDTFMQAREESLEELVGGFLYLTMEDVCKASSAPTTVLDTNVFRDGGTETVTVQLASALDRVTAPGHGLTEAGSRERGGNGGQDEDLEEEVLEESTCSRKGSEDALFRHRPASLTKFDNFVLSEDDPGSDREEDQRKEEEGEEEEEEDWMPTSGYMASFAAGNSAPEETPQTTETAVSCGKERQPVHSNPAGTITPAPHPPTSAPRTTEVTTPERKEPGKNCSSDQTDRVTYLAETQCDSHSRVCEDDVETPAWALNPGEAEEEEEEETDAVAVAQRVNVIEICTTVSSLSGGAGDAEGSTVSGETEDCSDEVVPFELDQDHDYDQVVYTPKFTRAEMNYLTSFLPTNS